jgi:hypothetical protein
MRLLIVPLCLFAAGSARVCSNEEKANAGASGAASANVQSAIAGGAAVKAALAAPRIGGTVGAAGDYSVEVALHEGGRIEALISDVKGALVTTGAKLSALVQAKGGASEKVELAFVPARGRFEGRAKAGVELSPGPVDVSLDVGGKAEACKLRAGVVAPRPKLGGQVLAAGDFSAELFARPSGEVHAFVRDSAGADVKADAGASFKARCRAKGGASEEIALSFDPPRACFVGKAKAGVELEPGPIEFVVDAKAGAGIGRLETIALQVDAAHGGQLVAVGDFNVELVAKGKELSAFVLDASGKAHAAGDLDLKLDVGAEAGTHLALKWDAPSASYKASWSGSGDLSLQPLQVSLLASGKAFVGTVASLQAAAKANFNAKANLDAKADVDANAKVDGAAKLAADAKAKANVDPKLDAKAKASLEKGASASVKVTPPKVEVKQSAGASAGAKAGGGAKASAGFSFGTK